MGDHEGLSGFSAAVVMDIQRIFACLEISAEQTDPDHQEYIAAVAKHSDSFSSKVVMPMSAQSEWRLGGSLTADS